MPFSHHTERGVNQLPPVLLDGGRVTRRASPVGASGLVPSRPSSPRDPLQLSRKHLENPGKIQTKTRAATCYESKPKASSWEPSRCIGQPGKTNSAGPGYDSRDRPERRQPTRNKRTTILTGISNAGDRSRLETSRKYFFVPKKGFLYTKKYSSKTRV